MATGNERVFLGPQIRTKDAGLDEQRKGLGEPESAHLSEDKRP